MSWYPIFGYPKIVKLIFFLVLCQFSFVHFNEAELVLGAEIAYEFELVRSSHDFFHGLLENDLDWVR